MLPRATENALTGHKTVDIWPVGRYLPTPGLVSYCVKVTCSSSAATYCKSLIDLL